MRYYEPDIGRFVNQDPIGLLGEAITKSTRWSGRQAHHKIPVEVFNNSPLLQRLEKQGLFKLNG